MSFEGERDALLAMLYLAREAFQASMDAGMKPGDIVRDFRLALDLDPSWGPAAADYRNCTDQRVELNVDANHYGLGLFWSKPIVITPGDVWKLQDQVIKQQAEARKPKSRWAR